MSCLRRRKIRKGQDRNNEGSRNLPQELVDECMSYVAPIDLTACALVCKSWSRPAQRILFKGVHLGTTRRYRRLEKTIRTSGHLVQLIHTLSLFRSPDSHRSTIKIQDFEKFCNLPFTHLESVGFWNLGTTTLRSAIALRRLFSLPTLCRVTLNSSFFDPAAFQALWGTCSPHIKHLRLGCYSPVGRSFLRPNTGPVALSSLKLESSNDVAEWLNHDFCPFDFSQLAALSVTAHHTLVVGQPRMRAAHRTIEVLEFDIGVLFDGTCIDLSQFSNLQFLRINIYAFQQAMTIALDTLATITSSSPIRRIVLSILPAYNVEADMCDLLDSKVAGLPLQHLSAVELETNIEYYNRLASYFPRLRSQNLLSGPTDPGWFERHSSRFR